MFLKVSKQASQRGTENNCVDLVAKSHPFMPQLRQFGRKIDHIICETDSVLVFFKNHLTVGNQS